MPLRKCLGAGILGVLMATFPARAAVSKEDVVVATRTLGFLERPMRGNVRIAIVHAPGTASSTEASQLLKAMQDMRVGDITLVPQVVPVANVGAANVDVLFLLDGTGDAAAEVSKVSRAKGIPCVTADMPQVQAGTCLLGVESHPKVKIVVNRQAAEASGIRFASVFRMLITEY